MPRALLVSQLNELRIVEHEVAQPFLPAVTRFRSVDAIVMYILAELAAEWHRTPTQEGRSFTNLNRYATAARSGR